MTYISPYLKGALTSYLCGIPLCGRVVDGNHVLRVLAACRDVSPNPTYACSWDHASLLYRWATEHWLERHQGGA